jgi:tRNA A37 threonylcarbamoyladenosine dehydratase
MRRELKKRGVGSLKVVYSKEKPLQPMQDTDSDSYSDPGSFPDSAESSDAAGTEAGEESAAHQRRSTPGSLAFVPSVAGLIIAGEVIKDLCMEK